MVAWQQDMMIAYWVGQEVFSLGRIVELHNGLRAAQIGT